MGLKIPNFSFRKKLRGKGLGIVVFGQKLKAYSVKAGAAHVAFAAPSRSAVQAFFTAALKAGGRIHGEPAIRDQETGYYSAAVLDFDNNSIEVANRPKVLESPKSVVSNIDGRKVLSWQKDVARSTADGPVQSEMASNRVVSKKYASPAMLVTHSTFETKPKSDTSTKALIGTLLGAAAGAAVAYAMTKSEEESPNVTTSRTITQQLIEAPSPQAVQSAAGSRHSYVPSEVSQSRRAGLQQIEYPTYSKSVTGNSIKLHQTAASELTPALRTVNTAPKSGTLIDTFIPPSEISRYPPQPIVRSHTESIIQPTGSQVSSSVSRPPKPSRASSAAITITPANIPQPERSVVTEVKVARDLPLPSSHATSVLGEEPKIDIESVLGSVAPSDSVSQVGSKKSRSGRRSKRHSSSGSSSSRLRDVNNNQNSVDDRASKCDGSKSEGKKESVVSMPIRPSSKVSMHRSVKSFLTGL